MKTKFTLAAVTLASLMAFGANAAVQQVSAQDAQNLQSMGTISVAQHGSSPMDMRWLKKPIKKARRLTA